MAVVDSLDRLLGTERRLGFAAGSLGLARAIGLKKFFVLYSSQALSLSHVRDVREQ